MHQGILTLVTKQGKKGWVVPIELARGESQDGTIAVPISLPDQLFPSYEVEYIKYYGRGKFDTFTTTMDRIAQNRLKTLVNGWSIPFGLRYVDGKPVVYDYVGALGHHDFTLHPLAEIEAENPADLDDLYSRDRIVIVGCDPVKNYVGVDKLLKG